MGTELSSPLGLIAGNGIFPLEFARSARARGLEVVAVAHRGETSPELEGLVSSCTWVRVGQLGKVISVLRRAGVRQAAFAGGITRVRLFGGVKLDLRGLALVARVRSIRDDVILRGIAGELEQSGIAVFSASVLLERSVPAGGLLTRRALTAEERRSALIGWEAARLTGSLDIGQAVIVKDGVVVAIEAVEGTDRAIRRAGELAGAGCVVVKVCKPQQDLRLDLPTIGCGTIESMRTAGASALVVEAGRTLLLEPDETVRAADGAKISIFAAADEDALR